MTVLHYTGSRREGGGIHAALQQMARAGRRHDLLGVAPDFPRVKFPGLRIWRGPRVTDEAIGPGNLWPTLRVAWCVRRWLRRGSKRIYHGHSRAGLMVALWLHLLGERRVIVSVHCYGSQRWFYRWAAGVLEDRLFWLTPAMRRYFGMPGTGWEQCLPGGVAEDAAVRPEPAPGRLRLGGAGFLVPWKRWNLVVEALALLPMEARTRVSFEHIGGPGETGPGYLQYLRRLTAEHGLGDRVFWRGPETSSRRLLSNIDVLVVPSHNEPYSMILQEALAAGIPVLAAASGGPTDVIEPEINGRFFADGDAGALAKVLQGWLQEPPLFDGEAIRRTARRADEVAASWAKIYARL